jgi:hypothetical protein
MIFHYVGMWVTHRLSVQKLILAWKAAYHNVPLQRRSVEAPYCPRKGRSSGNCDVLRSLPTSDMFSYFIWRMVGAGEWQSLGA